jgi:hypothetical protein
VTRADVRSPLGGTYLHTPGPAKGAWLVYPNRTTFRPGTRVPFYNYDPDDEGGTSTGWVPPKVVPEGRTRFYAFTGARLSLRAPAAGGGANPDGPKQGDPVDRRPAPSSWRRPTSTCRT